MFRIKRPSLDLDIKVAMLSILLLTNDTVNLLVVNKCHVNIESPTKQFSYGNATPDVFQNEDVDLNFMNSL